MQLDNKQHLKELRGHITTTLAPLIAQLGLTKVEACNIRYEGPTRCTVSVLVETKDAAGHNAEEHDYIENCRLFDLKPEWLHQTIIHSGRTYKIVGLNPKRWKFPVIIDSIPITGSRILITAEEVKLKLGRETA